MPRRKGEREQRSSRRPLTLRRRGVCSFCQEKQEPDYKQVEVLKRFMTDRAKIVGRGRSGLCQKHQRRVATAVKRARYLGLLPFVVQPAYS